MTITSKLPDVIDFLVDLFTDDASLGASTTTPVAVYDGPVLTQAAAPLVLWVGLDDPAVARENAGDEVVAATSEQDWTGLGARQRDETVTVNLCAEGWSGVTDVRTVRQQVVAVFIRVQDLIHADATLGGLISPGYANVTGGELRQAQGSGALAVRWPFQIICRNLRIGGAP